MNAYLWGSWLFFMGCLAFSLDAGLAVLQIPSIRSLAYLTGSLLFTLGSVLFILDARGSRPGP